jgi:serine/threonine protein kinase|tara:strand:+ start:1953 stop:3653 length:1701 start_codon:yes stop_codon:yes gene_type:complete
MPIYIPDEEIDLLCDEFERKTQSQQEPKIETYLERVNSDRRPQLLYWLLKLQLQLEPIQSDRFELKFDELRQQYPGFEEVVNDIAETVLPLEVRLPQIPGYTLERLVQRGGQGAVFRALQDQTGQLVAIKLVSTQALNRIAPHHRSQVIARLKKEIRIAASLKHMNVVKIYDAGECSDGFYFIMQLLEGGDLSNRAAALNQIEVAKIIRSVANALQEAHASGILHLDVKPQNILFDEAANQPLLADFGLARLSQESEDKRAIAGTIGYMAPEQAMGAELDSRADVYGLGATLYYLLTGKTAYENVKLPFTDRQRESWSPIPPRSLNRNINPQLERICMRCLEFDPDSRYQNCQEVAKAIDQFTVAEDGLRIATIAKRTIITSPLFLAINLVVYLQIQAGWAEIPIREPLIWITMFSMYGVVFFVFSSKTKLVKNTPEHLAMESMWAVWLAKMFAAIAVAGSLRLLASGLSGSPSVEEAILMCYPMFSALTGFVLATIAPRYWRKFYFGAALCWLYSFVLMLNLTEAPILYGFGATVLALVWGIKLSRLAREQIRSQHSVDLASERP